MLKYIYSVLVCFCFYSCSSTPGVLDNENLSRQVQQSNKELIQREKTAAQEELQDLKVEIKTEKEVKADEVAALKKKIDEIKSDNNYNKKKGTYLDPERDYLADSKMFYNYREYKRAIESSFIVLNHYTNKKMHEEALYLINESAEEIVQELDMDLYIKPLSDIKARIEQYRSLYEIYIELETIGYQYLLYYDKKYYYKLKKLNSDSEFIKKVELKHLARMGQFVTNPAYRYTRMINVTEKYWKIINDNPKIEYAADILLKIADIYLYLSEEGVNVKRELDLSQRQIEYYYKEAGRIYKKVKKEYPQSAAAQSIAYVIDNVKLRQAPNTKSKVIRRIQAGTLVKIIDRSAKKVAISNMYAYWFKVKLISGLEGWVYGFYLRSSY